MPLVIEPPEVSTDLEQIKLNGLDLNDGILRTIEALSFKPAEAKPQWADNMGADGAALVQEPHYTNAVFELTIRTHPTTTTDEALEVAGELTDALQACARADGGVALEWTPGESTKTYTWYAVLGELTELPTEMTGEAAGWLLKSPLAHIRLTCRPFGYLEPTTVLEATESGAEPLQVVYLSVGGDVPAEARALVTDKSTQNRRYLEWGRDVVASKEGNPSILLTAASLVVTNFTGKASSRSGAYSEEKVKRSAAVSSPTVMCGTGSITHVGSFKVYGRVYAASELARFRISYRNGEGPLIPLAFQEAPVAGVFSRIYLGEVTFDEAVLGEQKSEIRVEAKSTSTPIEVDLNYLELIPSTGGSARVRNQANTTPNKLSAFDTFLQISGKLTGKSLSLGGVWAGAGDEGDFEVVGSADIAQRTEVSDATLNAGRYALAGSEESSASRVTVSMSSTVALTGIETYRRGVFLRYKNTENWLMAFLTNNNEEPAHRPRRHQLVVVKLVAGVLTELGRADVGTSTEIATAWQAISLQATAEGAWQAWFYGASIVSEPGSLLSGSDSDLATGGALATGKAGIYDAQTVATANSRSYDNFYLMAAEPAPVMLYSGKSAEIRSDGYFRQDESGSYYGEIPQRGADLYLDPKGDSGRINRLALLARRNDVETEADSNVTDKTSVEVVATERFLAPR